MVVRPRRAALILWRALTYSERRGVLKLKTAMKVMGKKCQNRIDIEPLPFRYS